MRHPDDEYEDEDDGHALDDVDSDDHQALVWNLLLLINPGDEEAALRQFDGYREAVAGGGAEARDLPETLAGIIDWTAGFRIPDEDVATLIDCLEQLAARWGIGIDWGGDADDEDFIAGLDAAAVLAIAHDRLREHGYSLWLWQTGDGVQAGWMALRRDDQAMRELAALLEFELRPGGDAL